MQINPFSTLSLSNCILCDIENDNPITPICQACIHDLPFKIHGCKHCGIALSDKNIQICGKCLTTKNSVDSTFSLFHYQPPVDHLLIQLKFQRQLIIANIIGKLMADAIYNQGTFLPDAILPVPLHTSRIRERGFNQALEIAKPVAKRLRIPLITQPLTRIKPTPHQTRLSARERQSNLKNCFKYQPDKHYKSIAIVDDVITTGTTVNEIARVLKKEGVERVDAWSCAQA